MSIHPGEVKRLYAVLLTKSEVQMCALLAAREADQSTDGKEPTDAVSIVAKMRETLARTD